MTIYYLPGLILIFAQIFLLLGPAGKKISSFLSYFSLFMVMVTTGLKGDVDPDYQNYLMLFSLVDTDGGWISGFTSSLVLLGGLESFYALLLYVIKKLGGEFQIFYMFSSMLACYLVIYISRLSGIHISILFFFIYSFYFYGFWVITRFLIGALFGLAAVLHLSREWGFKKGLFFSFFGFGFHRVSVFSLPIVLVIKFFKKFVKKHIFILIFLSIPVAFLDASFIFDYFISDGHRYDIYIEGAVAGERASYFSRFIIVVLMLFFVKKWHPRIYKENERYDPLLIMMVFMLNS